MKGLDYTTDWLTEEEDPRRTPLVQTKRSRPVQQQGTLYLHECGPKAARYAVIGGCIGFFAPILFGLFVMFATLILQAMGF